MRLDPQCPTSLDEIRERLGTEPFNAELHQALGKALLKAGDLEAARGALVQAIILDPPDPWSHLYLGNLLCRQGAHADALSEFQLARRLEPDLAIALVSMAHAYHSLGELDLAGEHYRRATDVDPDDEIAQANLKRWRERPKEA